MVVVPPSTPSSLHEDRVASIALLLAASVAGAAPTKEYGFSLKIDLRIQVEAVAER